VDVSTHAWKVSFEDARGSALTIVLDGVTVPYLGLDSLIASKETYRERDIADLAWLRQILEKNKTAEG
jgi:hypothetical protein